MKTNKTCPLYKEEEEPVDWQDSGAAANGLLERQGTKIIIKRNSILSKEMEELRSSKSEQPTVIKTTLTQKKIPPLVNSLKMPSLRMKVKLSDANQNSASYPAPSLWNPPRERIKKLHGVHVNGTAETGVSQTPWPLFKLKSSNQKQKDQGVKRLKHDQDVEMAMKEKERIRERERKEREAHVERERTEREAHVERDRTEREAYEEVLIEERENEEMDEREREREWKERETELNRKVTVLRANGAEIGRGNKGEKKSVFVNKIIKKNVVRAKDDHELLMGREREWEQVECMERDRERHEEYQRVLDNERKSEQEELERKEVRERAEREETIRKEQVKAERERHRQHMKEERRREQYRLREEEVVGLGAQKAAHEKEEKERAKEEEQQREKERIPLKHMKIKHIKERARAGSGPPSGPFGERDRGKGIKRRPDVPPPSYHHTPDFGNAPKRIRKNGGEVDLSNALEGVIETLRNADCSCLFLKPVTKREAPDYLHHVKRPMDLSKICDRVRKLKYKSRDDFRNDILQITDNAHLYNDGRNPEIPPLADRLLELCDEELIARVRDLDEAEAGIERFYNDLKRQLS